MEDSAERRPETISVPLERTDAEEAKWIESLWTVPLPDTIIDTSFLSDEEADDLTPCDSVIMHAKVTPLHSRRLCTPYLNSQNCAPESSYISSYHVGGNGTTIHKAKESDEGKILASPSKKTKKSRDRSLSPPPLLKGVDLLEAELKGKK